MDVNAQYDEFSKKWVRYQDWDESVHITDVDQLMDSLAETYLAAAEAREPLRKRFGFAANIVYLQEYALRVVAKIVATKDSRWLLRGLVAISIEDQREDYRDTLYYLGELWQSAEQAGIDPKPYFDQVAEISNTETSDGGWATHDLMRRFQETAFYREITRNRLAKEEERKSGARSQESE